MPSQNFARIVVAPDNGIADAGDEGIAIVGIGGTATAGEEGLAFAGMNGTAKSIVYGVAVAGDGGNAIGGAGTLTFAYNGGTASGGDGSVAWSRESGPATVNNFGVAVTLDGDATVNESSIAFALNRNGTKTNARGGPLSVAVVRTHPAPNPAARPALAIAENGGIAIAYGGNYVSGSLGALLVVVFEDPKGRWAFATGVVDGKMLLPDIVYTTDGSGRLVVAPKSAGRGHNRPRSNGRPNRGRSRRQV